MTDPLSNARMDGLQSGSDACRDGEKVRPDLDGDAVAAVSEGSGRVCSLSEIIYPGGNPFNHVGLGLPRWFTFRRRAHDASTEI